MTASPAPISSARAGNPLAWAVYLGISWTWCIGMFLPVLMVRDYGIWGWIVFAVPNVLGAAAMGWVLRRPGSSERIVAGHRTACVAFSAITLAFHAFFLAWFAVRVIPWPACVAVVAGATVLSGIRRDRSTVDLILSAAVLAVSGTILLWFLNRGGFETAAPRFAPDELAGLAPVCLLGFSLCPYLDLTFHRGRQATTTSGAKWAFGVGFGAVFLPMLVLTLMYVGDFVSGSDALHTWIAVHLCVQIGFTWMAHLRALPRPRGIEFPIWAIAIVLAVAGGVIVWIPKLEMFKQHQPGPQMLTGELIYRLFMAFYGLVFPAYVWICMTPIRSPAPGANRRSLAVLTVAILVGCPMFWMGFVVCQTFWLIPGVAVVLLAKLVAGPSARVEVE